MILAELTDWVVTVPDSLPEEMWPMAHSICESFRMTAKRLMDLGLGYLTLDRASSTLSTSEQQRMQLVRAVRNRTTGVLYVLDDPSPSACIHWMCERFCGCFRHSLTWVPAAERQGGRIVATGTPEYVRCIAENVTERFI